MFNNKIFLFILLGAAIVIVIIIGLYLYIKTNQKDIMQDFNSQKKTFQLGEKFTLKKGETAIEKEGSVPGPGEITPERDYLEITIRGVVKRLLKPPGGEQRVVTLALKKGEISETIVLEESLIRAEGMAGLAGASWHGYYITLKDADAFGETVVLEVIRSKEQ